MLDFDSILVPIDFSRPSGEARLRAEALAIESGARLILLHVVEPSRQVEQPLFFGHTGFPVAASEEELARRIDLLDRLHAFRVPESNVRADYRLREGDPVEEILRIADESHCDLIVIGTHGRMGLERFWKGSVAESVLRRARCPVMIVKEPTHDERERERAAASHPETEVGEREVVLAYSGSPTE